MKWRYLNLLSNNYIWQPYTYFQSASTTQQLLHKCYCKENLTNSERKSYENCYPFIYYLEHGQNFYQQAINAPLSIKPVLLFYGMVQLLKACILTVDSQYPESTSVLAHGVSTRKRKKQGYAFLQDEVKIQKNGLFTHFSMKMFHVKHVDGQKYTMKDLLKRIPELGELFSFCYHQKIHYKVAEGNTNKLSIPIDLLDRYHMTQTRFIDFLTSSLPFNLHYSSSTNKNYMTFLINDPNKLTPIGCSPLTFHLSEKAYYIPFERKQVSIFSEIMVHYLILYNLSMISRYETEWWSELLHSYSNDDYPFINTFLAITSEKIPYLFKEFLISKTQIEAE